MVESLGNLIVERGHGHDRRANARVKPKSTAFALHKVRQPLVGEDMRFVVAPTLARIVGRRAVDARST